MTPKAITSVFAAAQAVFLPIDGQPSNKDLVRLLDAILPILLMATYDHVNGVHNLWGLVTSVDGYLHNYSDPFVCPDTPLACYDPAINGKASRVDHVCAKTSWDALLQDYKAYEVAEPGIKVFIEAVVNKTWICNLCNPKTFYSNVTAFPIFDHLCKRPAVYMCRTWYCSPFK